MEVQGIQLGSPYTSQVKGSRYALRELRVQSGGKPLRVFYAFDPLRDSPARAAASPFDTARS